MSYSDFIPRLPAAPAGARTRPRSGRLAMAIAALWLLAGLWGAHSYIYDYYLYRGFPPPVQAASASSGRLVTARFFSPALHSRRSMLAYLPPGYAAAAAHGRRFPVLYLLHPAPTRPDGYFRIGALALRMDQLLARHRIHPFLVVVPAGQSRHFANDTEWANARAGRYESFVLDAVHAVDRRWATLPERRFRAIGGLSEGGYGAANIALHHLRIFGVLESWSGYFVQTPTGPFRGQRSAVLWRNSPAYYAPWVASELRREPLRAVLYQGRRDMFTTVGGMRGFALELRRAGARVTTRVYSGGHNWRLWRREMSRMLRFADRAFWTTR